MGFNCIKQKVITKKKIYDFESNSLFAALAMIDNNHFSIFIYIKKMKLRIILFIYTTLDFGSITFYCIY